MERRKTETFFRQAFDFLSRLGLEKLRDPKFTSELALLHKKLGLALRSAQLLALAEDARSDFARKNFGRPGELRSRLEIVVKEILALELQLKPERVFQSQTVYRALSSARSECEALLSALREESSFSNTKGRESKDEPRGGKSRHKSFEDDFIADDLASRGRKNVESDFEIDDETSWKSRVKRSEEKKKRREERAELLKNLQEKLSQMRSQADVNDAEEDENSPETLFDKAKRRTKGHTRKTLSWALAFFGITEKTKLDEAKSLYRERAKLWHPDRNDAKSEIYKEAMIWLNDAWKILKTQLR